jgi:hypothetical protein
MPAKTLGSDAAFGSADNQYHPGLTKREYFACHIMGSLAVYGADDVIRQRTAKEAVANADALIEALNVILPPKAT